MDAPQLKRKIMKLELTRLEVDLIVYALIHVNDSHANGELESSFISAHRDHIDDLINDVNNIIE